MPPLRFTEQHLWVSPPDNGVVRVGVTDFAQQTLGDIVFVEAPVPGQQITAGDACGIIESVKTAADLYAPLSGVVVETNPTLADTPQAINDHPWESWIFSLRPDRPEEFAQLLDAESYRALTA